MKYQNDQEFKDAVEPIIKYMNDHPEKFHPHMMLTITATEATMHEELITHRTLKFLKD